jgi:hypothetical protein
MLEAGTLIAALSIVATLIGVVFTQWNSRKTKQIELDANRRLKLIELREQTANTIRTEKREVYLEILRAYRFTVDYWRNMGEWSVRQTLEVDQTRVEEVQKSFDDLMVQAELVSSAPIYDLTRKVHEATELCWQTHRTVNDRLFAENAHLLDRQTNSPQQLEANAEAIWVQVRTEIKRVFEEQGTERLYIALRNQIREELGFLALSPSLVPTPEELQELGQELNELE